MRQNGFRVLCGAPPTSSSACTLEAAIRKLDKNHLLILDGPQLRVARARRT